ncbi:serine hydrolase [Sphingobacterium spiritivorum]|uniref:serine hydrolase n=1 Tax=Sphingobacterium spiritivorum TaxID=258 RepID=UPI003DA3FA12
MYKTYTGNLKRIYLAIIFGLCSLHSTYGQHIEENKVDELVEHVRKTFNVPGIAVGIVKDGKVILKKGYGVSSINTGKAVDPLTNFGIASNSKAFTATALAMLIDQGKIKWDDRVRTYIPEFKLYNDYVSENFTIRDLLTHRSGLGLGAGDLMIWPDGNDFTPQDIIRNMQYLKPVSDFRTKYDYDNLLYVIAGVVIEKVSGLSWASYIQQHILTPLHMDHSAPNWHLLSSKDNSIDPHVPIDGKLQVIKRYSGTTVDAAGGIYSNVEDLTKWVLFQLNKGNYEGKQLIPKEQLAELSTPQTLMPVATTPPYNSLFRAYGLGFRLTDVAGKLEVSHTGGLEGIVTQIVMLPQLQLGIIVLTNQQEGAAFMSISNTIKDFYLGLPHKDWVATYQSSITASTSSADKITDEVWKTIEKNKNSNPYENMLTGKFVDNWLGEVNIYKENGKLMFASKRSPQLTGELFFYKDQKYVVKWNNRYFHADAFLNLDINQQKVLGFKMNAISPLTDFSYDFHDLAFKKVN